MNEVQFEKSRGPTELTDLLTDLFVEVQSVFIEFARPGSGRIIFLGTKIKNKTPNKTLQQLSGPELARNKNSIFSHMVWNTTSYPNLSPWGH